jgi:3-hydroxyisobutyrate dehydrogenase
MGAGIVKSLAREGIPVTVWNRTAGKAQALREFGAQPAASVADAVRNADCIITMLYDADAVLDVGEEVLAAAEEGTVWLQCATVGLDGIARLADRVGDRLQLVDAPVLGTKQPAESGALVVLVSGPRPAIDAVGAVLAAIGSHTQYVDDQLGHATALKLACNAWLVSLTAAAAQSLALTQALGIDPRQFLEAIRGGSQDAPYLQRKGAQMITADYSPAFSLNAADKDVALLQNACAAAGVPSDLADALRVLSARSVALGHGHDDIAAIRTAFQ